MALVMLLEGMVNGGVTALDGQYLKEYDPGRDGVDPSGQPMLAHVVVTDDPSEAMQFKDFIEFRRFWLRIDPRNPMRPDGKPNRPLTAFTVSALRYP
jgi:hypothetical protein